ncbi:phosphatidylinositol-specific phospholipase C/glycerophosphodiester phosphodiesterase family protein [Mucilaginibacter jinjuensis]|uniref:Altered inheritance of mitochondria protein 6 n=1 Tax=Mucilaginibacter jinjuensis TaxID=1176721 RepID=A0ABY7T2L5_9SPHI|nr:phosphatidylinositol-specific phospholipase C/glycerophosphodiester phosphodiesterase family protein [Mucilaginibacter jinjuensis]WCT10637.1 phosphatidylinositol-specific phospholipase C/glycerophosphodiester phosphodiesterase family protein [Mucilaginibacter jinjuensis]
MMQAAKHCLKHLKLFLFPLLILISHKADSQNYSLINAFAHNDYWHKRPLYDALDNGYTHVEADIYLRGGKLVVAHMLPILKKQKTLERLYFQPLADCIAGKNQIACPAYPVMLMIDIKSDADKTYEALEVLLDKYRSIISGYESGEFIQRQITVVLTGHKPYQLLKSQQSRLAFIDEDLMRVKQDTLAKNVYQTASCKYSRILKWRGEGTIPPPEHDRLCAFVMIAHKFGKKVRLWASPENETVWKELLSCGVDLINTDKLVVLRDFLTSSSKNYAKAE